MNNKELNKAVKYNRELKVFTYTEFYNPEPLVVHVQI